jgi:DNA-binding CsgD family transcriptional regulator
MAFWRRILHRLGILRQPGNRFYQLGEDMHLTLKGLAAQEGLDEDDLAADLVARGLSELYTADELLERWNSLSLREQQVVALVCVGLTNPQICDRLGLSLGTVKTYLRSALMKFGLNSRGDLRVLLAGWDFSAWKPHM